MDISAVLDELSLQNSCLFHNKKGRPLSAQTPLAPLADTHGHLTCFYKHDPAVVLARAALAGVRLLAVPIDPVDDLKGDPAKVSGFLSWLEEQKAQARALLDACGERGLCPPRFDGFEDVGDLLDNLYVLAGAHPYSAAAFNDRAQSCLRELLCTPVAKGVGEIGIDFGPYNKLSQEVQEETFRYQLRCAHELKLPVELHLRDAPGDETYAAHALAKRILLEEGIPEAGCDLHCFTCGRSVMEEFSSLGCYIAFGGAITFKKSDDIRDAAAGCPSHLILSETDMPYMAPHPLRSRECEAAMICYTAEALARVRCEARGVASFETYATLWKNACRFFGVM